MVLALTHRGFSLLLVAVLLSSQLSCAIRSRGEKCLYHEDCDTNFCSRRKVCECYPVEDYTTGLKVEQEYNHGICQSKVMTMCALPTQEKDGLPEWNCIANAECKYASFGKGSRQTFGVCECDSGYIAAENNTICYIDEPSVSLGTKTGLLGYREEKTMMQNQPHSDENKAINQSLPTSTPDIDSRHQPTTDAQVSSQRMKLQKDIPKPVKENSANDSTVTTNPIILETVNGLREKCSEHKNCQCNQLLDYGTNQMTHQHYANGKCLSRLNQTCSVPTNDSIEETGPWNCVIGAMCSVQDTMETKIKQGRCVCKSGYTANPNGTECFSSTTIASSATLKERIKAIVYMMSLAFNSFVSFLTRK